MGLKSQGLYEEAVVLIRDNLTKHKRKFGSKHPRTLITASTLGGLYHSQGRINKALKLLRKTLLTMQQVLPYHHQTDKCAKRLQEVAWLDEQRRTRWAASHMGSVASHQHGDPRKRGNAACRASSPVLGVCAEKRIRR